MDSRHRSLAPRIPRPSCPAHRGGGPQWTRRNAGLTLLLAFVASGCAQDGYVRPGSIPSNSVSHVTVEVVNRNFHDARVRVMAGSTPVGLGTVPGHGVRTFRVSDAVLGGSDEIRLTGELIASRRSFGSPVVMVRPGDTVQWRIEVNPLLSSLHIRRR
jgi:hypothetical protein